MSIFIFILYSFIKKNNIYESTPHRNSARGVKALLLFDDSLSSHHAMTCLRDSHPSLEHPTFIQTPLHFVPQPSCQFSFVIHQMTELHHHTDHIVLVLYTCPSVTYFLEFKVAKEFLHSPCHFVPYFLNFRLAKEFLHLARLIYV